MMEHTLRRAVTQAMMAATLGWGVLTDVHAAPYAVTLAMPRDTAAAGAPDTVATYEHPHRVRLWGWGLAVLGVGMATYGILPRRDGDSCELMGGFSCDESHKGQQKWLFFGGAALGSIGAAMVWSAQRDLDRRAVSLHGQAAAPDDRPAAGGTGDRKNPWIGMGLGLAGAAAGTALFWNDPGPAAMLVGIAAPSLGQLYAGTIPATAVSLAVRGGAGVLRTKGVLDRKFGNGDSEHTLAKLVYVTGVTISLFDIWKALHPAGEAATRRAGVPAPAGPVSSFSMAPALFPVGERRLVPGLAVTATF